MLPKKRACANKPNSNLSFIKHFQCPLWIHANGLTHKYHLQDDTPIYLCSDCHRIRSDYYDEYISKLLHKDVDNLESDSLKLDKEYNVFFHSDKNNKSPKKIVTEDTLDNNPIPRNKESIHIEIDKHINRYLKDNDVITHTVAMFRLVNTRKFKIYRNDLYLFMPHFGHYVRIGGKRTNNAFNAITHELFITLRMERMQTFDDGRDELHATAEEIAQRAIDDEYYIKNRKIREHEIIEYANQYSKFIRAMVHVKCEILGEIYKEIPSVKSIV